MSVRKECACVITNSSAKQCDWLSHARPAPFPFPLFLFSGKKKTIARVQRIRDVEIILFITDLDSELLIMILNRQKCIFNNRKILANIFLMASQHHSSKNRLKLF